MLMFPCKRISLGQCLKMLVNGRNSQVNEGWPLSEFDDYVVSFASHESGFNILPSRGLLVTV